MLTSAVGRVALDVMPSAGMIVNGTLAKRVVAPVPLLKQLLKEHTPAESVTWIANLKLPKTVGVPLSTPDVLRVSPDGNPCGALHVNGGVPPLITDTLLTVLKFWGGYGRPWIASGRAGGNTPVKKG